MRQHNVLSLNADNNNFVIMLLNRIGIRLPNRVNNSLIINTTIGKTHNVEMTAVARFVVSMNVVSVLR